MKTIYITEEQKKKLKRVIAAQDQVGSKVNAGIMDGVVGMCENVEEDEYELGAEMGDISPYYHVMQEDIENTVDINQIINSTLFKSWFGKSKVVDKNGKPLIVYHGSPKFIGNSFNKEYVGKSMNYGESGVFCTTQDMSWAKRFSYPISQGSSIFSVKLDTSKKGDILSGFLKLEHPLDFFHLTEQDWKNIMNMACDTYFEETIKRNPEKWFNDRKKAIIIGNHQFVKFDISNAIKEEYGNFGEQLKRYGYDGYIALMDNKNNAVEYCFIEPNQFKSIYSLAFNPESDSIYENKSNINTKEEKTNFGKVWYINAVDNSFRFALYRYDDDSNCLYLSNVFVEESSRRQGLGNYILNLTNDFAKKMNVKEIFLKVKKGTFMCKWYEKNGYEYFSDDETDSNYIWMVKEVKQNNIIENKKKVIKNDKGEIVPDKCDKCGGEVVLQIHGEPVYICKDCGKYFGTMPFNLKENVENETKWNGEGEKLEPLKKIKKIPPVLYHASYKKNRESILKNGIFASVGDEYRDWWNYEGPNGEIPDDNELEYLVFLTTKPTTWSDNHFLDQMDIFEIDTKQLDNTCFYLDPDKYMALKGSICYTGNIPPSAIKLYDSVYPVKSVNENVELEIKPDEVDLSSFNIKKKLNPKFWIGEHLDSRIRLKLLDISDDFIEYLGIDPDIVKDVIMTGSLANFNWNEEYSDIDLHILLDYSDIDENVEFVKQYFMAQKNLWNNEHKDLKIFGFPVEVYVQDINEKHDSTGIYSLEKDKWLREPDRDILSKSKVNKKFIKDKVSEYTEKIDKLTYIFKKNKNDEYKLSKIANKTDKLWDEIKNNRKKGFEIYKGKEINNANIIFKTLRRFGYLNKLYNLKNDIYNKLKSLNNN